MNHLTGLFWGVKNPEFLQGLQQAINHTAPDGIHAADNIFTIGRNLGFLEDARFVDAWQKNAQTEVERAIVWRLHVLSWAARSVLARAVPGDYVECACYKGTSARLICDDVGWASTGRRFYLYDLFEHDASMTHHAMPEHGAGLYARVKARFADLPSVVVTQGSVPAVLRDVAPERIAFMHIDMNNAESEIGALEVLFERLSPGGILILDDYGWRAYRQQKLAEDPWLAARGYTVLEMPTGQGMVIK